MSDLAQRVELLEEGLRRVLRRAGVEANEGAPAGMVAVYVELEVRHALAGHTEPSSGCYCDPCHDALEAALRPESEPRP